VRIDHFSIEGMLLGVRQVAHSGGVLDCREMNHCFVHVSELVGFLGGAVLLQPPSYPHGATLLVGWCHNSGGSRTHEGEDESLLLAR
jgi:hypothetical protein